MVLVAMSLLLLMGAAAVAVDLAAMRLDRSTDQKVTDSAASAGALEVLEGTGQDACETALEYVAINSEGIGSIDTTGCASDIPATCDPADPRSHSPLSTGRFDVTFHYPVDDDHDLMTSGQLGAPTQTVVADDGDPCERVGVEMSATHQSLFAQLLGFDQGTTTVHSVALGFLPSVDGPPLNLLVLDRSNCDAILLEGGGSNEGRIIVNAVEDPATGERFPGVAAADTDPISAGCSPVIRATGNMLLRADGPPCPEEVTAGTGEGCGRIQVLVPGITSCTTPGCQIDGANAEIIPDPSSLSQQITREQIDHEYNCWPDYFNPPAGLEWATSPLTAPDHHISGCTGEPDHIYDLIASVGANGPVGGHTEWSADLSLPCDIPSSNPGITVDGNVAGDIRVDCEPFTVRGPVTINNANVVFDGAVSVTSSADFTISNPIAASNWAFFRDGALDKNGQANLTFEHTMVYLSEQSGFTMSGGSDGNLEWSSPDDGRFNDLALWSDSSATHVWLGQSNLEMDGVFFIPWATADYSGKGRQNTVDAQWVAHRLHVHGEGELTISPKFEFPLKRDDTARTTLIR